MKRRTRGWRVDLHRAFLHRALNNWKDEVTHASNEELKTLTDIVRYLYDKVVRVPQHVLLPLQPYRYKVADA